MNGDLPEYEVYFRGLGEPLRGLVRPFESLGYNCEFAFVQHGNGFRDGNLLSWALADDALAVAGLVQRDFKGLFALDALEVVRGGHLTRDMGFGIAFHSKVLGDFVNGGFVRWQDAGEISRIHAEELEKLEYLAGKMRRQLTEGRRFWVYKARAKEGLAEAMALHAALNRRGRNRLLWVSQAVQASEAGWVEMLDQGFYAAKLRAYSPEDVAWRFDVEAWGDVLRDVGRVAGGVS